MAGQPTIQGSRYAFIEDAFRSAPLDAYYAVVGSPALFLADDATMAPFTTTIARLVSQHAMDYAGAFEHFSWKIRGNTMPVPIAHAIRINDVDTTQFVLVTEGDDGKYACLNDAAAFVAGDKVVGRAVSDDSATGGQPGCLQHYVEMTPATDEHTCFRTGGSGGFGGGEHEEAFIPLSGGLAHYNSNAPTYQAGFTPEMSRVASQMVVRARGAFTYLQGYAEVNDEAITVAFEKNGLVASDTSEGPFLVMTDTGYYLDEDGSIDVVGGDRVSLQVRAPGSGGIVFSTGLNFSGASGNEFIDMMVCESYIISGDPLEPSTRAEDWNFFDPDPRRFQEDPIDNPRAILIDPRRTVWVSPLLGNFYPVLATLQADDLPSGEDFGRDPFEPYNSFLKEFELEPTFDMGIRRIRAYMDLNTSGTQIRTGIMYRGTTPEIEGQGLFVEMTDSGWYENSIDEQNVIADDDSASPILRGAACLYFSPALVHEEIQDGGFWVLEAIAHIASVSISYGVGTRGRECLVRVLPDPVEVDALPCATRLARSIKITRPDDVVIAFTEHDEPIVHEETTYKPIGGGFAPSASQLGARAGEVGNMEAVGYADDAGMPLALIFGGQYDNAVLESWLLPWGEDNDQPARRNGGGVLGRNRLRNGEFKIEILSPTAYLKQKSIMEFALPTCRRTFGAPDCGIDVESFRVSGIVTSLTTEENPLSTTLRRRFTDVFRTEDDGFYAEGLVTFVTGDNVNQTTKVKIFASQEFVLWDPLVYPIEIGDEYTLVPGCAKTAAACKAHDNFDKFNGFLLVPGTDAASETPSGKMGR